MSWDNANLKVEGEDDFIVLFSVHSRFPVQDALEKYFTGVSVFDAFINDIPAHDSSERERIEAEKAILSNIKDSLNAVYRWYRFLLVNERKTITGSEYWSLVPHLLSFPRIKELGKHVISNRLHTPSLVQRWSNDLGAEFTVIQRGLIDPLYNDIELMRLGIGLEN